MLPRFAQMLPRYILHFTCIKRLLLLILLLEHSTTPQLSTKIGQKVQIYKFLQLINNLLYVKLLIMSGQAKIYLSYCCRMETVLPYIY